MSKNTAKTKLSKLLKEGNSLLKKNKLSQALTKFQEAQKENPNNAKINRAVSTITTKIKQSKTPKSFFQKYMSATPGRIQELEQREIELNNELKGEKERLRMCRLNVKNRIKEIKSLDKESSELVGERNILLNQLGVMGNQLNNDQMDIDTIVNNIRRVIREMNQREEKRNESFVGGKSKRKSRKKSRKKSKKRSRKKSRKKSKKRSRKKSKK